MSTADEILTELESLLDQCKDLKQHYMEEALDNFRTHSRDFACFCDGKYAAFDDIVPLLESIIDTYGEAGAGATS